MSTEKSVEWKCPVCGSEHASDWRLTCHISGMAWAYPNDHHREWALNREPKFLDSSSIGASASMLRPFVVDEIGARLLTAAPDLFGAELISNLIEGYKLVASMEIRLHRFVLQKLKDEYGDEEWWTKGVPRPKRKACSDRCEEDDNRYDRWLYFNLRTYAVGLSRYKG